VSRIFLNLSFTVWQPAVIRLCHLNLHRSPFRGYNPCSYSVLFPTRFRRHDGVWRIQVLGHSVHQGMHQLLSYSMLSSSFLTTEERFISRSFSSTSGLCHGLPPYFPVSEWLSISWLPFYPVPWCNREDAAVKVDDTPLIEGSREYLRYGFQHAEVFIAYDELHIVKPARTLCLHSYPQLHR
jgi:hypothetical protein